MDARTIDLAKDNFQAVRDADDRWVVASATAGRCGASGVKAIA